MRATMREARQRVAAAAGVEAAEVVVDIPRPGIQGDLAIPCFRLAKRSGGNAEVLARDLAAKLREELGDSMLLADAEAVHGYVNVHLDLPRFSARVLDEVVKGGRTYGASDVGGGRVVVIDFSSPNIAKPMSVGHLRSTIIGQAIYNLYRFLGYRCIGDNHLGDWGTQFGHLIHAYKTWGDDRALSENPIRELLRVYVKFDEESKANPELADRGRAWFKRLEDGDPEAVALWTKFKDLSLSDFARMYDLLGTRFDLNLGESFYSGMLADLVRDVLAAGVAERASDGRVVIPLNEYKIEDPLDIQKSDGASLYATRDLATALHRIREYHPALIVYVVGSEQKAYFRQVFAALKKLGHESTKCVHVDFGLVRLPEGRMSTRKGRVILLEDVLVEAISRAERIIAERNPSLDSVRRGIVARQIGVGAVKYGDLSQDRVKEVVFDWEQILNLTGDSAPYLQYSYVRARSILDRAGAAAAPPAPPTGAIVLDTAEERRLYKALAMFPIVVEQAADTFKPNVMANYLFDLAERFHAFYNKVPVLRAPDAAARDARLLLVTAVVTTLENGLGLLGIECPEEM